MAAHWRPIWWCMPQAMAPCGNLRQCRHYSLYLALQLKARLAGIDTPVYGLAPSFHSA